MQGTGTEQSYWEHFPHGADIGVRGVGPTLSNAFEQAATALAAVVADLSTVKAQKQVTVECSAPDPELLLCDWLNAIVYEMAVRSMVFCRFQVQIDVQSDGDRLQGTAWGEAVDVGRHQPAVEVKGATYTALSVARNADGLWVAQCVVDV